MLIRLRKNEVKFVQVLDPVERELRLEGDFKLRDLETGEVIKTYVSPALRKRYLKLLAEHNAQIKKLCDATNTQWFSIGTDTSIFDAFYKVLGR